MSIVATSPAPVSSPVLSAPVPPQSPTAPSAASHPSPCPSWCKDRHYPLGHLFGPTSTAHWSPQAVLSNPHPAGFTAPIMMRAELYRGDEESVLGEVLMFVQGETDVELTADEVDVFIAQAQGWVDTLRVLRRQMG